MFEVVGEKSGVVKNEKSPNKGKGYQFLYITFEDRHVRGKACREVFIFDDVNEIGRPVAAGDVVNFDFDFNGRIKRVTLA